MKHWKDIIGSPLNDGDIVTVRRIPTDTPAFTARWKPAILDGVFFCGPENWVLPWTHAWAWRSLDTPLDWPIRGPAANPWHDVYLDPPADRQHVWIRREFPGLTVIPAVRNHDNRLFFVSGTNFYINWWETWGWKAYR
jgi:hypothetical protein